MKKLRSKSEMVVRNVSAIEMFAAVSVQHISDYKVERIKSRRLRVRQQLGLSDMGESVWSERDISPGRFISAFTFSSIREQRSGLPLALHSKKSNV